MPLKRIKLLIAALYALAISNGLYAQVANDTLSLSIEQLFARISRQHLQLAADRLKELMATERTQTARTARLPEINIGLRGGFLGQPIVWQNGLSHATRPESPDWQQNYAIDFNQPLYQGGKIRYAIRQADLQQELALLQTSADQADIKLALLEQYLSLFSLYKQHLVLNRNIEESERRLKDIRRMKEEGIITNNDVLRSEMQLTDDRLALTETENNIRIVSQQLDILLGLEEHLLLMPDTTLLAQTCPITSYDDYISHALQSDPSLLLLRKQTELAENNVKLTYAEQLPRLSLTASNTLARPVSRTLADMYNNSWNIGLSFSYPLSSLYSNRHRMKEAKLNAQLTRNAEEQKQQHIRMTLEKALLKHQEATKRVEALKLSVKQAEENYRIMYNRYMNQLAILTDLLDADNLRLNAELKLTTARTQVIYTYYELQRAIGKL
ncbi:TolC family protein [uncultured Bacteroides sp.]|uniref:TolC family protein n=1 Tax=uncultured Bacteroides sp. TaxID=162156 RepID=UPI00260E6043|nr:TolC family protein [uncultured Bacteroides sp.]